MPQSYQQHSWAELDDSIMTVWEVTGKIAPPKQRKPNTNSIPLKRVDTSYTPPIKAKPFNKPKSKHLS